MKRAAIIAAAVSVAAAAGSGAAVLTLLGTSSAAPRPPTAVASTHPALPSPATTRPRAPAKPPTAAAPTAAAQLPVLTAGSYSGVEPTDIGFSGDGGNIVGQITWSSWTATGATGQGISDIQGCVPNCAEGTETPVTATITLSQPVNGQFTAITETRSGITSTGALGGDTWPLEAS